MNRKAACPTQQVKQQLCREVRRVETVDFFNLLTSGDLLQVTEAHLPEHRERLYPPTVTLSMFLKQALSEDASCQKAVNGWAMQRVAEGLKVNSLNTAAYCDARVRLPLPMVQALVRCSGELISARAEKGWRWHERAVKLVDGTTVRMADTPANQQSYPQPLSQAGGLGFPMARLTGVICLSSGALIDLAMGPYAGQGSSELGLLRELNSAFHAGDVMLADSYYCNYFLIESLQRRGVDAVFEQHGARITDFRRGRALGKHDHVVQWTKPAAIPHWMTPQQYAQLPETMTVREVRVKRRILVTTMLNDQQISKEDLSELYAQRWQVELDLRNLKSTLGMNELRCRTPQMNEKHVWVTLLAYNLIRLLMAQAARWAGVQPRELSFKHTLQLWSEWLASGCTMHSALHREALIRLIAQRKIGTRPGRIEPRVRKRKQNDYPWMSVPRHKARAHLRIHGHPDLR